MYCVLHASLLYSVRVTADIGTPAFALRINYSFFEGTDVTVCYESLKLSFT